MFYAGSPQPLRAQIEKCFTHSLGPGKLPTVVKKGPRRLIGLVSPHAGYMYSGPVAAHSYYNLAADGKPDTLVIFGPNHTGRGSGLALMDEGVWRTPLGDVGIDSEVANQILRGSSIIDADDSAHLYEHSIEVQLPFLQFLYGPDFKFVPICFLMQDLESSREVGRAVGEALSKKNAVIIASTDMTHYESQKMAERNDKMAIDSALKMDEVQYYSTVESYNISTCGYGPTIALITAVKMLGAKNVRLLCYRTSGDITGDYSAVVGYASLAFSK
jgi:AmmeMemoRadiSam system protein B